MAQKISDSVSRQVGWGPLRAAGIGGQPWGHFWAPRGRNRAHPLNLIPECVSSDRSYRGTEVPAGHAHQLPMFRLSVRLNVCLTHLSPESLRLKCCSWNRAGYQWVGLSHFCHWEALRAQTGHAGTHKEVRGIQCFSADNSAWHVLVAQEVLQL